MSRIRLELVPELGHVNPQVVGLPDRVDPPDFLQQLPMGNDFARLLYQGLQQTILVRRQVNFLTPKEDLPPPQIHPQAVFDELGIFLTRFGTGGMPQRDPHPGKELFHTERFGQVVVGPGIESRHLVRLTPSCRKDDDGP